MKCLDRLKQWLHTNQVRSFKIWKWKFYYAHAGWRIIISRSASDAIQFAIDHAVNNVYLKGTFEIQSSIVMKSGMKLQDEVRKKKIEGS